MEKTEELKYKIMDNLDFSREISDEEILEMIEDTILMESKTHFYNMEEKSNLCREIFNSMRKLDIIQELIDDASVSEIMINGTENIFIEQYGKIRRWEKKLTSRQKLEDIIQQIVAKANRVVNEANPIVDARLEDGSRVNIVLYPIALNGPIVTIRRFPEHPIKIEDLIAWGSISEEAAGFLEKLVQSRYNIFVSGGTGSGKTTFLNVLSNFIPQDERIITIEDSAELQISRVPNLVRLETRNANVEGSKAISIRDLIKSALRMRPDRIVIGEVRGAEALDMLQAMNTGHDGSLSTGHANSPVDMLSRLETMVLMGMNLPLSAIRRQIVSGIDILVHLGRLRDKSRRMISIEEIEDLENGEYKLNLLYRFKEKEEKNGKIIGEFVRCGELKKKDKLYLKGIFDL